MDPLGRAAGCGRDGRLAGLRVSDNSNQMHQCEAIFPPTKPQCLLSLEITRGALVTRMDASRGTRRTAGGVTVVGCGGAVVNAPREGTLHFQLSSRSFLLCVLQRVSAAG